MPLNERKDLMEKMVRFMVKWAAVLVTALSVGACDEGEEVYPEGDRTVLLYLAGDNNLSSYGYTNIKSLREGMKGVAGRVVVYFDPKGSVPAHRFLRPHPVISHYADKFPKNCRLFHKLPSFALCLPLFCPFLFRLSAGCPGYYAFSRKAIYPRYAS